MLSNFAGLSSRLAFLLLIQSGMTMPNMNIRDSYDNGITPNNEPSGNSLGELGSDSMEMSNPSGEVLGDALAKTGNQQTPEPVPAGDTESFEQVESDPNFFPCSDGPYSVSSDGV